MPGSSTAPASECGTPGPTSTGCSTAPRSTTSSKGAAPTPFVELVEARSVRVRGVGATGQVLEDQVGLGTAHLVDAAQVGDDVAQAVAAVGGHVQQVVVVAGDEEDVQDVRLLGHRGGEVGERRARVGAQA